MSPRMESLLRDSMSEEAGALPVTGDPWPGFATRERRHLRVRRTRRGAVAAAVAALVGVQSGLVPLPGWAPAVAIAARPAQLAEGPTRGSLAGDTAWTEGMRQAVQGVRDTDGIWKVTDRDRIDVVYAADVGDQRLALMVVPLRFGLISTWTLTWYAGPAGAPPERMTESGRQSASADVASFSYTRSDSPGLAVVVGPAGSTVSLARGFTYTPEGRVERGKPVTYAPGSGLAELVLPPVGARDEIHATVTMGGRTLHDGGLDGSSSWSGTETGELDLRGAPGESAVDRETLRSWAQHALDDARLAATGTAVTVHWTGKVNGQPAAVLTLRPAGGGVLAYALHGSDGRYRQDYRALFPAAGFDGRPIAWRMRGEGGDDRTSTVHVVAPRGTARVTAGGDPVPLDGSGFGTLTAAPNREATVTAYDSDGRETGSTPILPFENDLGGVPGADSVTRIAR